jgi:hypothetical protein
MYNAATTSTTPTTTSVATTTTATIPKRERISAHPHLRRAQSAIPLPLLDLAPVGDTIGTNLDESRYRKTLTAPGAVFRLGPGDGGGVEVLDVGDLVRGRGLDASLHA